MGGNTRDGESSLSEGHVEAMKNDLHNCGVEYAHPLHMRLKKAHRSIPRRKQNTHDGRSVGLPNHVGLPNP